MRMRKENKKDVFTLRDISLELLHEFKSKLRDKVCKRALYVIEENARVLKAIEYLREGKIELLGELLYETHYGLKNEYEVSCQELDFLVSFTENIPEVAGARMMGGGFGGCTLNLIEKKASSIFLKQIKDAYKMEYGIDLPHYFVEPSEGAMLIA